jgi:hypothetical protein
VDVALVVLERRVDRPVDGEGRPVSSAPQAQRSLAGGRQQQRPQVPGQLEQRRLARARVAGDDGERQLVGDGPLDEVERGPLARRSGPGRARPGAAAPAGG